MEKIAIDWAAIQALHPQERIAALRELQARLDEFIKARQAEIQLAEEMLERARTELAFLETVRIEQKPISIEKLFERERVEREEAKRTEAQRVQELALQPIQTLYERVREIYARPEPAQVELLSAAVYEKEKAISERRYIPTAKALEQMTSIERMLEKLKGK